MRAARRAPIFLQRPPLSHLGKQSAELRQGQKAKRAPEPKEIRKLFRVDSDDTTIGTYGCFGTTSTGKASQILRVATLCPDDNRGSFWSL